MPSGAKASAQRLQKVLARAGLGSRRELERWIVAGRIQVNGQPAALGQRVSVADRVVVDGCRIPLARLLEPVRQSLAYHKPLGEICTRADPRHRPTVFDKLPSVANGRWISVGRLDINSSGLLIMTTDGELAQRLMHPARRVPREYAVRVFGQASPAMLKQLRAGVALDDGPANFNDIVYVGGRGANHWYHVVLLEGRQHEVRRLWASQGLTVSRLIRVRYGTVTLPRHRKPGAAWRLQGSELDGLYRLAGLKQPVGLRGS